MAILNSMGDEFLWVDLGVVETNRIGIHGIAGVGEKAKGGALKRVNPRAMAMKPVLR
jgi:hypothetical protein